MENIEKQATFLCTNGWSGHSIYQADSFHHIALQTKKKHFYFAYVIKDTEHSIKTSWCKYFESIETENEDFHLNTFQNFAFYYALSGKVTVPHLCFLRGHLVRYHFVAFYLILHFYAFAFASTTSVVLCCLLCRSTKFVLVLIIFNALCHLLIFKKSCTFEHNLFLLHFCLYLNLSSCLRMSVFL